MRTLKNKIQQILKFISSIILLGSFQACSVYKSEFDCLPGKGVGCESVSFVNELINEDKLDEFVEAQYKGEKEEKLEETKVKRQGCSNCSQEKMNEAPYAENVDSQSYKFRNVSAEIQKNRTKTKIRSESSFKTQFKIQNKRKQTLKVNPVKSNQQKEKVTIWFKENEDDKGILHGSHEKHLFIDALITDKQKK